MSTTDHTRRASTAASTTRPPSKRVSTIPAPQKAPSTIHPTAIIANHAALTGTFPITIGAHAVLHPYARISSTHGPVTIGEGCILWEKVAVGGAGAVELGRNVILEACSVVEGGVLGEGCVVEAFGRVVGDGARLGRGVRVATFVEVGEGEEVDDYMVLYGRGVRRRDTTAKLEEGVVEDLREKAHGKHIKSLEGLVPSNLAKWV
jgi:dynactin-6